MFVNFYQITLGHFKVVHSLHYSDQCSQVIYRLSVHSVYLYYIYRFDIFRCQYAIFREHVDAKFIISCQ
jgi:hypothetical protein